VPPASDESLRVTLPAGGKLAIGVYAHEGRGAYAVEVSRPE
jgi:hypothetical protein